MKDYFDRPDGEMFVDELTTVIPTADTWEGLSINQLIEVKNDLTSKAFAFRNNPAIIKSLHAGIGRLDALIAKRLAST